MAEAEVWEEKKEERFCSALAMVRGRELITRGRKRTESRTVVGLAVGEEKLDSGRWGEGNPEGIHLVFHHRHFLQNCCSLSSTLSLPPRPAVPSCHPQIPRHALPCSPLCLYCQNSAISVPLPLKHMVAFNARVLVYQVKGDERKMTCKYKSSGAKSTGNMVLGAEFY